MFQSWLLRQLFYKHVPKELIERPKQGFAIPLAEWLSGCVGHCVTGLNRCWIGNDCYRKAILTLSRFTTSGMSISPGGATGSTTSGVC